MRWITFFILLYLAAALQFSHLGGVPTKEGEPWPFIEFLPLLAVFYALYAAETAAPLAALLCGLAYDIGNRDFFGTNLVPMALVGYGLVRIRLSIFREHFVSQVIMTLLAVFAFALLSALFRKVIGAPLDGKAAWTHFTYIAGNGVYTAIVAPFAFALLFRFHGLLGFSSHGPRTRGHG
jgi:rod shape-determining protein MreD